MMTYDGMRRIPCLLCGWQVAYDPTVPGLRDRARADGLRHYETVHGLPEKETP